MSLREKQSVFALNFAKLVQYAYSIGYEITYGEGLRTKSQQYLYFEGFDIEKIGASLKLYKSTRRSKTMNSKHLLKLAHDINLFKNGQIQTDAEAFKPLAKYWKSLHPANESGYDWGWDLGHFQMNEN